MCTVGDGQSFIEGIAQFLLVWFQSRLIAGIIGFQEERLLPSWGLEDMKKGQKAGDNSPPATSCQGAGEENQRHEEKGTAETLFQVPNRSHERCSVLYMHVYDQVSISKKLQTKQKYLVHHIEAGQHRRTRKHNFQQTSVSSDGHLSKGPRTNYQQWMSFPPIHLLCLPCWSYFPSLSTGPCKTRDFHPLASSLHGWSLSFQIVQAFLETQLPLPPAFFCVFPDLLFFAALSDISVLHLHASVKVQCWMWCLSSSITGCIKQNNSLICDIQNSSCVDKIHLFLPCYCVYLCIYCEQ